MPVDLKELRRLHEAATPGPWLDAGPVGYSTGVISAGGWIALFYGPPANLDVKGNVVLACATRNALPELLDEIERLSRQWTCFHCGFQTGDRNEAAAHFGEMGEEEPLCLTWKDLDEHGKASELQNALGQLAEANVEIERLRLALSQIAYLKVPVKKIAREALGK